MTFSVRWPDGSLQSYYSPSLVVEDHLEVGSSYGVVEFGDRAFAALREGSERVRVKYGMPCTACDATAAQISRSVAAFPDGQVTVIAFSPGRTPPDLS